MERDYDYIVIGSGFGGSVAALRLAEKGYTVAVLEAGHWFRAGDFPKTNWSVRRWLWWPSLGCYGIQRLTLLPDVLILSGAGVGGGSLVYCSTLLVPPEPFFRDPQWADLDDDWQKTLAPYYDQAKRMLGVATNPRLWRADEALADYARELGREALHKPTEVGIFFGEPGVEVPDPYFDGEGPPRVGCTHSGHCMVGCNNGGKNSLDRNYLHLAMGKGVEIIPDSTVVDVRPIDDGPDAGDGRSGYRVTSRRTSGFLSHPETVRTARGVVFAAGALGTNRLLMRARERGALDRLSDRLGERVRTNSEVLNGVRGQDDRYDYSRGISITSGVFVDDVTHVEVVRYPAGSDLMAPLATLMVDGGGRIPRWLKWLGISVRHPIRFFRIVWPFGWARRTVICLVMQTLDNHLRLRLKRRWWWPFKTGLTTDARDSKLPTYIPAANEAARGLARRLEAEPSSALSEVVLNTPMTAHILGGCAIGANAESGVVDKHCRVFGYENMFVTDGAMIPANLGVNPSLSITALAEHAMSHVEPKSTVGSTPTSADGREATD